MKYNGVREHGCQQIADRGGTAGDDLARRGGMGLLRGLLFAERRRFWAAASEFDLHPAQAGALMQLDEHEGLPDARDRLPARL